MSVSEETRQPQGGLETDPNPEEMDSADTEKPETEYHLANETVMSTPRSVQSPRSARSRTSSEVRPSSARERSPRTRPKIYRPQPINSNIPLPLKVPALLKTGKSTSKTNCKPPSRLTTLANKHTLEIQFINKNKRFIQMKKELLDKQKPIIDLYQNLTHIKKRLEELGKNVKLEEIKLIPFEDLTNSKKSDATLNQLGAGEQISLEVVRNMKSSIEEIPKTLMDICKNLLSRRELIVELLESITKSEVDVGQVSDKIESLKCEGQQLQKSLDAVINEHETKICELVNNWQKLLNDKQNYNTDSKIEEMEIKLKEEERLREESSNIIHELHRKMEEKRIVYDKSVAELNGILQTLREQMKKLEQDLDTERKSTIDFKSRNTTNAQNIKTMRAKITELENEKVEAENSSAELQKKIRLLQDQLKHKEAQWNKEKDEMSKSLKHQENLLQKLTADKNNFETRLQSVENVSQANEGQLLEKIDVLNEELHRTKLEFDQVLLEKNQAVEKCKEFESYVTRMSSECKETMNKVSYSIEWGKASRDVRSSEAEMYMQDVVKDLRIRELEDKICEMEKERELYLIKAKSSTDSPMPSIVELELETHKDRVKSYQLLLEDSEKKLKDKLRDLRMTEVESLRAEIRQLKVRQENFEEQNVNCSTKLLYRMLEDGRQKLNDLMRRSVENDSKLQEYMTQTEKQKLQMNEMENLLRYREHMANVLKSSRNELMLEKESLARYSREVRAALVEVSSQSTKKDAMLKSLQDKVALRESQLRKLEAEMEDLEEKLRVTNEKRYKLQETVGMFEKELQRSRVKIEQLKSKQHSQGTSSWSFLNSVYEVVEEDKAINNNKNINHYNNSLMPRYKDIDLDFEQNQLSSYCKLQKVDDLTVKNTTVHTNCHHKANSRSLISLSLQTVDLMKTRLNFLSSVNADLPQNEQILVDKQQDNDNLNKILKLTAHRYEYLQNQAEESYDDLANLVKLAVTQKGNKNK